ncbi:MAG: TolC family protein [Bacteroidota bacterium]
MKSLILRSFLCTLFFLPGFTLLSQDTQTLTLSLSDVISMAKGQTPEVLLAKTRLTNAYWRFQSFKANFKPQFVLDAQLPVLDRSITAITLPDGSDAFLRRSLARSSVNVSLEQNIGLTGGNIFARTGLQRIDLISDSGNTTSYLSTPITVGITQPILRYNDARWEKQIQPLVYDEAERGFNEEIEEKAMDATGLFFDIFIAQISLEAAFVDRANADTLYRISQGRYNVGKIAENELLQMELSYNQMEVNVAQATIDLEQSTENLRNFLGIKQKVRFDLIAPDSIPEYIIDAELALNNALTNRSEQIQFERRVLQAEQEVARAKGENGVNINLFGSFGFTGTANTLSESYQSLLDQQSLNVGIEVPIADWGKAKSQRKIAESNLELVRQTVAQERTNFERNILIKIQQLALVRNRLDLAKRSFEIALKRYDITRKRYLIGKVGVTELNIALAEQSSSRQAYMQALRSFWMAHQEIRSLSLYDFIKNEPIQNTSE